MRQFKNLENLAQHEEYCTFFTSLEFFPAKFLSNKVLTRYIFYVMDIQGKCYEFQKFIKLVEERANVLLYGGTTIIINNALFSSKSQNKIIVLQAYLM